jgi:hypothetical protein
MHINKLKLGSIYAEQLYLKWDNALTVNIGTLSLTPSGTGRQPADLQALHRRMTQLLRHADDLWIGSFRIGRITSNDDLNGSLFYDPRSKSRLELRTKRYALSCTLLPVKDAEAFLVETELHADDFNTTVHSEGLIRLDSGGLYLTADANVSNRIFLSMGMHAANDALHLTAFHRSYCL